MVYDIRSHVPEIVEEMRQDMRGENVKGLESNKVFIEKIFTGLKTVFKKYLDEKNKRWKHSWVEYENDINSVLKNVWTKTPDEITMDMSISLNRLNKALEEHEKDYWETVVSEVLRYTNDEYQKVLTENYVKETQ